MPTNNFYEQAPLLRGKGDKCKDEGAITGYTKRSHALEAAIANALGDRDFAAYKLMMFLTGNSLDGNYKIVEKTVCDRCNISERAYRSARKKLIEKKWLIYNDKGEYPHILIDIDKILHDHFPNHPWKDQSSEGCTECTSPSQSSKGCTEFTPSDKNNKGCTECTSLDETAMGCTEFTPSDKNNKGCTEFTPVDETAMGCTEFTPVDKAPMGCTEFTPQILDPQTKIEGCTEFTPVGCTEIHDEGCTECRDNNISNNNIIINKINRDEARSVDFSSKTLKERMAMLGF